jgi:hypothetical protein
MTERKLSSDIADVVLKNDVVYVYYKKVSVTLEQIKAFIAAMKAEFADITPFLQVADISQQSNPRKEIRDYLGKTEVTDLFIANAIVATSLLSKMVGNLYLSFNKPQVPTKIFSNEAAALQWLEQFRN